LVVAAAIGIGAWRLQDGSATAEPPPAVEVTRGNVIVSVGGVGRITEARNTAESTSAGGGISAASGAVFARASGRISRILVAPGQRVTRGEPLALLDDSGSSDAAIQQARDDLAVALLELQQRQTSDPLLGLPPTGAELSAARLAVTSARERLGRLLGGPLGVDVSAARLELRRAESELETLKGWPPGDRARAIEIAQRNVQLAEEKLTRLLAPPSPADVVAAQAEIRRAEAELAALKQRGPDQLPPTPEALAAAQAAVDAARLKLARLFEPPNAADVTAAELEVERAKAELRTLRAGPSPAALAAASQAVAAARARLARLLGPPLEADVTAVRLEIERAEADLALLLRRGGPASEIDIDLAKLRVESARSRLASARALKRHLTVRAPAGGTITALLTVRGATVDPSTPIMTVADLDHLAVSIDLSEFDVAFVEQGMDANVRVDALGGEPFAGTVSFVGLAGVQSSGVVSFPVRISLTEAEGVKPGMTVSVRIVLAERLDVVQVPIEGVALDEDDNAVVTLLLDSGATSIRSVTLGLESNTNVEILEGLEAGERIVLAENPSEGGQEEDSGAGGEE
jgi:HlyD family secretion protein